MADGDSSNLSIHDIVLKGTIIALIVSIPSLSTFILVWVFLDDLLLGVISGAFVHFIAMGFSLKISKRLLVKK